MSKKNKLILIGSICGLLLVVLLLLFLSGKTDKSYDDYVDGKLHMDFTERVDYDMSWDKNKFDPTTVSTYTEVEYSALTEDDVSHILNESPEWLNAEYAFYPDDAIEYLECIKCYKSIDKVNTVEKSTNTSYYSYSEARLTTLNINGKDIVFVNPHGENIMYIYELSDEVR